MKKFKNDFTKGDIKKHLIKFAAPLLASSFLQTLYNLVDAICVGQMVGTSGLASIMNSIPLIMFIVSFFIGLSIGLVIVIAQFAGANDTRNLKRCFETGNVFFLSAAVIMTIAGLFLAEPLLRLINIPAESFNDAHAYLTVIFGGLIFTAIYNMTSAYLRGLGDSKTPMFFVLITTLLNIPLDIAFIGGFWFIPKMGVEGAAWATIISQAISCLLCLTYLYKKKHIIEFKVSSLRFHTDIFRKIIKLGLYSAIQMALLSVSFIVMTGFINQYGGVIIAAAGAGARLDTVVIIPAQAIGQSVSAVAAQNIGIKKYGRARSSLKWGILFSLTFNIIISVILFLFGKEIMSMFTSEANVMSAGAAYLKYMAFLYVPFGIMICINGLLQGAGDTKAPMFFTLFSAYAIRIPAALLFSQTFKMGIQGIYLGMVLGPVTVTILAFIYYIAGRWTKMRVAEKIYDEDGHELNDANAY